MKCPRDRSILAFTDAGHHMRNKCPQCKGVLLDEGEVAEALGQRAGKAGVRPILSA